ncbi:MAG TPA: hypothetical protein VHZ07_13330 [Bryobacteraceae bacterium]|jgi:hypothetical protein|nr:hypothetical protein [Bryobacteraceae bacterium]
MLTRREFLGSATLLPLAAAAASGPPLRLAIVTTVYRYLSHGQHIGDRFLVGYPHNGEWHKPNVKVVSLYVDQKPEGDLSEERAKEFGLRVYPTIAEALCCGGNRLACDAVLIVGEHGNYPRNEKGQTLYPRYEFFEQCVKVFKDSGRAVPVYNDKHLSYSFDKAQAMVAASKQMDFPMLAGSSLPVTWRLPDIEMPLGAHIEDAVMVGVGGSDAMDFHALEGMQCMLERRKGGETGVKSVQLLDGDKVWEAGKSAIWSEELLSSALSRSDTPLGLTVKDGRTQDLVGSGVLPSLVPRPAAYLIEYRDGSHAAMLMLDGAVQDFNFAARVRGTGLISTQFFLSPVPNVTYSACLVSKIEQMFTTGHAPYRVERTLLTSGILESCLTSRLQGNKRLETPHLAVSYAPPAESQYCRA